ncbi:MAG TPA: serine/threonine-protein kinase [Polyangiaceae bacterium]
MADAPVGVGEVVSGRYRIDRLIGSGSMGFVLAGWHLELDQPVALKFLNPEVLERNEAAQRFRREVRATAKIKSEHVARVIDVGALESGIPYMVMELLQGNNLEEELFRRGVLPVEEAVGYMLEAVEALAEAHAAGIIHRDLKPANLFIARRADRSRLIKVLDFGISKSLLDSHAPGDMSLTAAGVIIGSPLYMSPEQMRSTKDADYRSDIWSLGAILFQLVTGRPPYIGDTIPEICAQLYSDPVPVPSSLLSTLPRELDAVLLCALARNPDERYQTVAEFGASLADFAPQSRVHAERAQRVLAVTRGAFPSSEWPSARLEEAPTIEASVATLGAPPYGARVRRWALAALLLVGLVVLGLVGWERSRRAGSPPRAAESGAPVATLPARDSSPRPAEPPGTAVRTLLETEPDPATTAATSIVASASAEAARAPAPLARPKPRRAPVSDNVGNVPDFGGRR